MPKEIKGYSFKEHLKENLKDAEFASAFQQEKEQLKLALKIAELRKKQGLSQTELAKKIGTTQSVVSRLENTAYQNYSLNTLKKIASVLNARLIIDLR